MKKVQLYKLPLGLRWYFASEFIRQGLRILIGWSELERYLTKDTKTFIFKQKVTFHVKKDKVD